MTNQTKPNNARLHLRLCVAAMALVVALAPVGAQAGFEIRGAGIPQAQPQSGGAIESDSTLAPIGMMPDATGQPTIPVTAVPIDAPAPVDQSAGMGAQSGDVLSGFGDDLPLVIALQQVAPAGYQFAFSPGVDLGQRVSWQGGKPWRDVARDMLGSKGLTFDIRDDNVMMVMPQGTQMPGLQTAQVSPPPPPAAPVKTVDIRRQKPNNLASRIRAALGDEEVPVQATTQSNRSAAEELTSDWDDAEADAMAQSGALNNDEQYAAAPGEDLSPIELTAQNKSLRKPAAAMSTPSAMPTGQWRADAGMTLRDVLQGWAGQAGVDFFWSIDYDYRLRDNVSLGGTFTQAASQLLDQFANAKPRPYAQLHQQGGQPRALVIKAYGVGY